MIKPIKKKTGLTDIQTSDEISYVVESETSLDRFVRSVNKNQHIQQSPQNRLGATLKPVLID